MPEPAPPPACEWDANVYHRISAPQVSWGRKVLSRISLRGDETILDAGCGTGRLTRQLLEALPTGRVMGVDRSQNMVKTAREHLAPDFGGRAAFTRCNLPQLPFECAFDGIFSNAAFHWVLDHEALFRNLYRALRPGGWLCAQCGGRGNVARLLARASGLMATSAYSLYFAGFQFPWEYADPATTSQRLAAAGFTDIETSLEDAPTVLANAEEYREFVAGVVLRQHMECLPKPDLSRSFISELVREAQAEDPPFLLDFCRLNLRARKPHLGVR